MELTGAQMAALPSESDVEFYQERGWWISPPILTQKEIEDARFGTDRYYSGDRDALLLMEAGTDWDEARGNVLRQNDYVSLQIEELRRLVNHPVVAASAARLARTDAVRLFHDQLLYKPPGAQAADTTVGWHTDIAYWETCSSRNMITAWIPFQDVNDDMGPMMVIDRSHRWGGNDRLKFFHETELDDIAKRIQSGGARLELVPMLLVLGQVSFHHCQAIHGSRPNLSKRARVALAVHMQDHDNHYVESFDENGHLRSHLNDFMCRKDEAGHPDYSDPDVCPLLWNC